MANLKEITGYKQKIMQTICTSESIVSHLRLAGENTLSGKDMRYLRIFPYGYVPDVTEVAQAFVCFDIDVPRTLSGSLKDVSVFIYVFAHQNLMRTANGVLIDVLVSEIDTLMNGSEKYGIGKLELESCTRFSPVENYHGRIIRYIVRDFNRICGAI